MEKFLGKNVVIRAVTYHYIGRVTEVTGSDVVLEDAAWLSYSGRWSEFLATGSTSNMEVEPYPAGPVAVNRAAIVDCCEWTHKLIRKAV